MELELPQKPPANSPAIPERIPHRSAPTRQQPQPLLIPAPTPPDETPLESFLSTATLSSTPQSPQRPSDFWTLAPGETRAAHAVPPSAPGRANPPRAWLPPPSPA